MISFPRSPSPVERTHPAILFKHLAHSPQKEKNWESELLRLFVLTYNRVLLFGQPLKQTTANKSKFFLMHYGMVGALLAFDWHEKPALMKAANSCMLLRKWLPSLLPWYSAAKTPSAFSFLFLTKQDMCSYFQKPVSIPVFVYKKKKDFSNMKT